MTRIEIVEARTLAEPVASVMRESWPQPCVHFTAAYLQWQFAYRADLPAISAVAFDDDRIIGHAGLIPRRLVVNHRVIEVFHLSFVCVLPEYRGQGIAGQLYRAVLKVASAQGWPFIAFTMRESPGQRTFFSGTADSPFHIHSLGEYIVHGYLYRPTHPVATDPTISISLATPTDDQDYIELVQGVIDSQTLGVYADDDSLRQWSNDPRGSRRILARRDGELIGAVRVARGEVSTQHGLESVTSVEHMFLNEHEPSLLQALANAAGTTWSRGQSAEYVAFANVGRLSEEVIRKAGVRRTHTRYLGHLGIPFGYPDRDLEMLDITNMAVS